MSDGRNLIFTYDSTFDGFLSVVYYAVKNRLRTSAICPTNAAQLTLDSELLNIETNVENAETVKNSVCNLMGYDGFKRAYHIFLNSDPTSATQAYNYLLYGFKYGKKTGDYIKNPELFLSYQLELAVVREVDRMKGFLRFAVMDDGVEYAAFEPTHDILPLIVPHFAQRLRNVYFVIHDTKRQKAAVHTPREWFITDASRLTAPPISHEEENYRLLWKKFYHAVTIRERKNEKLQDQLLPKKYRKNMPEFTTFTHDDAVR